jgi:non-heme chloroperoxidase
MTASLSRNVRPQRVHDEPTRTTAIASASQRNATLKVYAGAPHGLAYTHKDELNADLLAFLKT